MPKEKIDNLRNFINSCNISIVTYDLNGGFKGRDKVTNEIYHLCDKNTILYTLNENLQNRLIKNKPFVRTSYIDSSLSSDILINYIDNHIDNCDIINFNTIIVDNIQDLCILNKNNIESSYDDLSIKAEKRKILDHINNLTRKLSKLSFKYGIHIVFIFDSYDEDVYLDFLLKENWDKDSVNIDNFLDCYIGRSIINIY